MVKNLIRNILIYSLIISMSILSSLTTYADTVAGDNGGGGQGNAHASDDYKAWYRDYQGYRFYIINSNLERVTDVYDFLFTTPSNIGNQYYSTRFDGANTPTSHNTNNTMLISDLASLTGSQVSDIQYPVVNNLGHGDEFREWFLAGAEGNFIGSTSSTTPSTGRQPINVADLVTGNEVPGDPTTYSSALREYINTGATTITSLGYLNFSGMSDEQKNLVAGSQAANFRSEFRSYYKVAKQSLTFLSDEECIEYAMGQLYTCSQGKTYRNLADETEYIALDVVDRYYLCSIVYSDIDSLKSQVLRELGLAKIFNPNSLLSQNIPLSGGTTESVDGSPALLLLNERGAITVPGYDTALQALTDNHYLVVEPICWICIPSNGRNYPRTRTYGSYYNLAEEWVRLGGVNDGGFYHSYMTKTGNNCLTTNSDVTTETGKTVKNASVADRQISQSLTEMKSLIGLSMHIYSSDMTPPPPDYIPLNLTGDWTLNESEISKAVSTGTDLSDKIIEYTYECLDSCNGHDYCSHSCNNNCANNNGNCSHEHDNKCKDKKTDGTCSKHSHGDKCKKYYCGHSSTCNSCSNTLAYCKTDTKNTFDFTDAKYKFKLKNTKVGSYPKVVAELAGSSIFTHSDNTITAERTSLSSGTQEVSGFKHNFVIYRGNDNLTYAKYMNNISTLGFSSSSSKTYYLKI